METRTLVKEIREKSGISSVEFSKSLGLSDSATYQWEHGHSKPSKKAVKRIVILYGALAPEECCQLQILAEGFHETGARFGKGKGRKRVSYALAFKDEQPLAEINVGIWNMQIHDWGRTYRGKQVALNCFEDNGVRHGFRYSMVYHDKDGYFIRRMGLKFYFCEAEHVREDMTAIFG